MSFSCYCVYNYDDARCQCCNNALSFFNIDGTYMCVSCACMYAPAGYKKMIRVHAQEAANDLYIYRESRRIKRIKI